jgi:hypothetical protein
MSRKLYRKSAGQLLCGTVPGCAILCARPESFSAEHRETKSCIAWIRKRKPYATRFFSGLVPEWEFRLNDCPGGMLCSVFPQNNWRVSQIT